MHARLSLVAHTSWLACFLSLSGCEPSVSREAAPVVLQAEGKSFVEAPEHGSVELDGAARLGPGQTVHSGNDGRLLVSLLPGALIQVEPNTVIAIEQSVISKDGNLETGGIRRHIRLRLSQGVIFVVLQFEPEPSGWEIETPQGKLSATTVGACRLEVDAQRARLTTVAGEFIFRSRELHTEDRIAAGYVQEWPSPPAGPMTADSDPRSQSQVQETLGVERILLSLQRRERFSVNPWR